MSRWSGTSRPFPPGFRSIVEVTVIPRPSIPTVYRDVLSDRRFRRLIAGFGVSFLGDGMSFVAVAWLAVELAPPETAGWWVGTAVAAATLPGVVGALVFGRRLRRLPARRMLMMDSAVRGGFLLAVPAAWFTGVLSPPSYVALLAISSLLHAWGGAGKYTLVAELLPTERRLAANTLVGSLEFAAIIIGPAVAGLLVSVLDTALVLGLDALTHLTLIVVTARIRPPDGDRARPSHDVGDGPSALRVLRTRPALLGLLALTWCFNLLYGPVEVALPLHVTTELHGSATLLGWYWTLFGAGAVVGGTAAGALRRVRLWPVMILIVTAWGTVLVPFGLGAPTAVTLAGLAVGGVVYGPFGALTVTLIQSVAPRDQLATVLAARSAVLLTAAPVGTALGGPITTLLGPGTTLGVSGLATILLGVIAAAVALAHRRRSGRSATCDTDTEPDTGQDSMASGAAATRASSRNRASTFSADIGRANR